MAFNIKELAPMGYTGAAPNLANHFWFYANSAADDIDGAGFFNAAAPSMRPGDLVIDGAGRKVRFVNTITEGVVALADANVAAAGGG
jgi:hypothetical protein